jgi:hypothetical protein
MPLSLVTQDIVELATHLLKRKPNDETWSLCELKLSTEECEGLWSWLIESGSINAQCWLRRPYGKPFGQRIAFGLVLMVAETEWLRREARGVRGLWTKLYAKFGQHGELGSLFLSSGQPTAEHRHLLEETANRFGLLNIFGQEGHQNWYVSLYLQIAFTYHDFKERLPEWLAGWRTLAINILLDPKSGNSGFSLLWNALSAYRRNNVSIGQVRGIVENSPWVLPEWRDEILVCALKRRDLSERTHDDEDLEDDLYLQFLSEPLLIWNPQADPYFTCELINLTAQGLTAGHYCVWIGSREVGRIIRQADGGYTQADAGEIHIPIARASDIARIEAPSGESVASQEIRFWPSEDEINLYDARGRLMQDAQSGTTRISLENCLLLHPDDLQAAHTVSRFCSPISGYRLSECIPANGTSLILQLDGDDYWTIQRTHHASNLFAEAITWVRLEEVLQPHIRQIRIQPKTGFKVLQVRHGVDHILMEEKGGQFVSSSVIEIQPYESVHGCSMMVRVQSPHGLKRWIKTRQELDLSGNFWLTSSGVVPFDSNKSLNCHLAETTQFLFKLPEISGNNDQAKAAYAEFCLLEGSHFVRRLQAAPISLSGLDGFGAPLHIVKGPYHAVDPAHPVSVEVNDCGLIRAVTKDETLPGFSVVMTRPLQLTVDHKLKGVTHGGDWVELMWTEDSDRPAELLVTGWEIDQFAAILLTYNNIRIGAYWCFAAWSEQLLNDVQKAAHWAYILRHGKAPILARLHKKRVREFARKHAEEVLPVWESLTAKPLPGIPLKPLNHDDAWKRAMRQFWGVHRIQLDGPTADAILCNLSGCNDPCSAWEESLAACASRISSPFLFKAVLDAWLREFQYQIPRRPSRHTICQKIAGNLLSPFVNFDAAVESCAQQIRVNDFFLLAALRDGTQLMHLQQTQKNNLKVLLNHNQFSKLLTHQLTLTSSWPTNN